MSAVPQDQVRHHEHNARGEFFIERDGRRVAELTYAFSGKAVVVGHTWVDPVLRGGKLAPNLVEAAAQWARRENLKIVPVCSYVRAVFARSAQYADVWER